MPVFPSSSIASCAIHWMLTAAAATGLERGTEGAPPAGAARAYRERAAAYADVLLERFESARDAGLEAISRAARVIAGRVLGAGHLAVRGANKGVPFEAFTAASGVLLSNAFEGGPYWGEGVAGACYTAGGEWPRSAADGGDADVLLLTAVAADDPREVAWAREGRRCGNVVVGIGPVGCDELAQQCDVWLPNCCADPAGAFTFRGGQICPLTGIVNNLLMQMLLAETMATMIRAGEVPATIMGMMMGARAVAYNERMHALARERGY
jgi:hypothetical protein